MTPLAAICIYAISKIRYISTVSGQKRRTPILSKQAFNCGKVL
jgi:hypothetical protein